MGKASTAWKDSVAIRPPLSDNCSEEDIAIEALWIQETLTEVLNQYAKPIRLTPYSKRWWGAEVKEARRTYTRAQRAWRAGNLTDEEHREARNTYYRTIRKAKRECWEAFLGGAQELRETLDFNNSARC